MQFYDIFNGIKNPKYVVQQIESAFDRRIIPSEHLVERREDEFRHILVDCIMKSDKLVIESEIEPDKSIRHTAEVFILTREEVHRLIQNVTYHSQAEILSFLSTIGKGDKP